MLELEWEGEFTGLRVEEQKEQHVQRLQRLEWPWFLHYENSLFSVQKQEVTFPSECVWLGREGLCHGGGTFP